MVDRPILFSAPMVRGLIAEATKPGTGKTQTRRIMRLPDWANGDTAWSDPGIGGGAWLKIHRRDMPEIVERLMPKWRIGDRLWVRETFALERCRDAGWYDPPHNDGRPMKIESVPDDGRFWTQPHYRASDPAPELDIGTDEPGVRWKPGIHMPRWVSRLTLHVTNIRVERLQDISKVDVVAEGVSERDGQPLTEIVAGWHEPFAALWDSINGERDGASWSANPWIVAITFRPELRNIDTPAQQVAA